jgi:hypothetical protein
MGGAFTEDTQMDTGVNSCHPWQSDPNPTPEPSGQPQENPSTPEKAIEISRRQYLALTHLAKGKSIRAASRAAGIGRNSIHRWLKTDPAFRAAFNAWRHELHVTASARLMATAHAAVDVVRKAVEEGDARIALAVLKHTGMLAASKPGACDPKLAAREITLEKQQDRQDLYKWRDDLQQAKEISHLTESFSVVPETEKWIAEDGGRGKAVANTQKESENGAMPRIRLTSVNRAIVLCR